MKQQSMIKNARMSTGAHRLARALYAGAALLLLAGCGDAPESEAPLGETDQALDEALCAFTPPDVTCEAGSKCVYTSGSTYGHSTCSKAFIGEFSTDGEWPPYQIDAMGPQLPGNAACGFAWVRARIWKRVNSGWTQLLDRTASGTSEAGRCKAPYVVARDLPAGRYKIAASAGIYLDSAPVTIRSLYAKELINGLQNISGSLSTRALTRVSGAAVRAASWSSLSTAEGRSTMKYAVGCALPPGRTVTLRDADGNPYSFAGELGVAPEWEAEPCGAACQEAVSACVLARVNLTGAKVPLFMNGDNEALGFRESAGYERQEGAYFGNLFSNPPVAYACKGRDADVSPIEGRLCMGQNKCPYVNPFAMHEGACAAGCSAQPNGTGYTACTVAGRSFRPITVWTQ